MGEEG